MSSAALLAGPVGNIPGVAVADLLHQAGIATPTAQHTARAEAVQVYLAKEHFAKYRFLDTSVSAAGQTFDWVDPTDLDPKFSERMSNPPPTSQVVPGGGSRNEESDTPRLLREELRDPIFKRPDGLVPVLRPNLSNFINGASGLADLTAFLASLKKALPQPAGTNRLYTGYDSAVRSVSRSASNIGMEAWVNMWDVAGVYTGYFSLVEAAVGSDEASNVGSMESVEFGVVKDPARYGDNQVHYFTYFNTTGYLSSGDYIGGYDQDQLGFVPYPGSFPPGAIINGFSTVGGVQMERRLMITKYNGAWWLQDYTSPTSYTWLGYYPIGPTAPNINFRYIDLSAVHAAWYSEVYDPDPTYWTTADVAAGKFASAGLGSVGWIRNPINYRYSGNVWFPMTGNTTFTGDPRCYSFTAVSHTTASNWTRYWFFGGPGWNTSTNGTSCR